MYDEKGVAALVAQVAFTCPKLVCARYGVEQPKTRQRKMRHSAIDERDPCEEGCLVNIWAENGCGPEMVETVRAVAGK